MDLSIPAIVAVLAVGASEEQVTITARRLMAWHLR